MKIKCIIIDDEPLARKGLREYITDIDFLILQGEFDSPLKAAEMIGSDEVQLIFLDVQMPRLTGIEFLKTVKSPPPVIFTTAFAQFALDGFDLNALDYLVKPISFDRFVKAAMKAKDFYALRQPHSTSRQSDDHENNYLFIKSDNKLVKIFLEDILYVEAMQNYVTIHTPGRKYITYLTFRSVEEYLSSENFIKTHKSYIVAAKKIDSIEGNDIRIGDRHIPISRQLKEEVMEKLLKGKFLKR